MRECDLLVCAILSTHSSLYSCTTLMLNLWNAINLISFHVLLFTVRKSEYALMWLKTVSQCSFSTRHLPSIACYTQKIFLVIFLFLCTAGLSEAVTKQWRKGNLTDLHGVIKLDNSAGFFGSTLLIVKPIHQQLLYLFHIFCLTILSSLNRNQLQYCHTVHLYTRIVFFSLD